MAELPRPSNSEPPATFEELLNGGGASSELSCLKCGAPATHSVTIAVAKLGGKTGQHVTRKRARLCEPCAVRIYSPVARALR